MEEEALRQLNLILDQTDTQNGRTNIQQMFEDFLTDFHGHWSCCIAETILDNIRYRSNYSVSDRQKELLAKAIAQNHLNLQQYYIGDPHNTPLRGQNAILKGIVLSTHMNNRFILRSDGQVVEYENCNSEPGLWVEIKRGSPSASMFESGRDERWCEECWPRLIEEFEMGHVDEDAFLRVCDIIRPSIIKKELDNQELSPRLQELLRRHSN